MNQECLATFLDRVKQCPLDITLDYSRSTIGGVVMLPPFAQQIRSLVVIAVCHIDIQTLSAILFGSLPLLHTLTIEDDGSDDELRFPSPPTCLLFEGATNIKTFTLHTYNSLSLSHFAFPNLTTLYFRTWGVLEEFSLSLLLDFFEASPSLQYIEIGIAGSISCEGVAPDRVLVLPYVKGFFLNLENDNFDWEFATHLSCPSAERAGFQRRPRLDHIVHNIPEGIYPPLLPWSTIVRQYTVGIVDEIQLVLEVDKEFASSINFWSSNKVTLDLCYNHPLGSSGTWDMTLLKKTGTKIFSQASRTIRYYPLLANVKTLVIRGGGLLASDLELATSDVWKLLESMSPLERLVLYGCDLRPYLSPFLETPPFPDAIKPTSLPPVKEFEIIDPIQSLCGNKEYAAALVKLAESQHERGMPFELVLLPPQVPPRVVEELSLSVNKVESYALPSWRGDRD
jgi:hypothetical protein